MKRILATVAVIGILSLLGCSKDTPKSTQGASAEITKVTPVTDDIGDGTSEGKGGGGALTSLPVCKGDLNFDAQSGFLGDATPFLAYLSTGTFHKEPANIDTLEAFLENIDITCNRYITPSDLHAWLAWMDSTGYGIEPYPGCIPCQAEHPLAPVLKNTALINELRALKPIAPKTLLWVQ